MRLFRFVFLLTANCSAFACTCDYTLVPVCQQMRSYGGAALFLGTVTTIHYRAVHFGNASVREQIVSFKVEDAFHGGQGDVITLNSIVSPGMCGFRFRKGLSYLVDAWGSPEALSTSSCGMTRVAAEAADSIRFLRALRQNPDAAIIFGTVKQYAEGANFVSLRNKAIPGTTVALDVMPDALPGSERREVKADSTGWYEFVGLPGGVYTVTMQVPSGFSGVLQHTIDIPADGCAQVDVRAHAKRD